MVKIRKPINPAFASSLEKYEYTPLDTSQQQVRLAKFQQDADSTIQCEIRTFDLDDCPEYAALSYVWGPPAAPRFEIIINRRWRLDIRENLHECLLNYCAGNRIGPGYIWIDQVSIDQSSLSERNHQVGLMSRIYSGSEKVYMWLLSEDKSRGFGTAASVIDSDEWVLPQLLPTYIQTILSNAYFTRLWIVQEILLAKHVVVVIQGLGMYDNLWRKIRQRESAWSMNEHLTLEVCLLRFSWHACENPLDRVYGLMGIVAEDQRLAIDYSKTAPGVFQDVLDALRRHAPSVLLSDQGQLILRSLSEYMCLSGIHQNGLNRLFLKLKATRPERCTANQMAAANLSTTERKQCLKPSKVIAIGLEEARICGKESPETQDQSYDRWWFDLRFWGDGTTSRWYVDCSDTETPSKTMCTTDFEQLLRLPNTAPNHEALGSDVSFRHAEEMGLGSSAEHVNCARHRKQGGTRDADTYSVMG
ncbi:heterokaryon incompatibility protein-domain-containing protein [Paraphoma chrysanthemicola]|nr:heterokaryon incompatibility protein-domain-containing protein [Paraphoma chrysanthemicola]